MSQIDIKIQTTADTSGFKQVSAAASDLEKNISRVSAGVGGITGHTQAAAGEFDRMLGHIEHSFSASRFSHGLMAALGIGTGSVAVEHMLEKWKELWNAADEAAKKATERAEQMEAVYERLGKVRLDRFLTGATQEQQLEELRKEGEKLDEKIRQQEELRQQAIRDIAAVKDRSGLSGTAFDPTDGRYGWGHGMAKVGELALAAAEDAEKKEAELQEKRVANQVRVDAILKAQKTEEQKITNETTKSEVAALDAKEEAEKKADAASEASLDVIADKWVKTGNYLLQYRLDVAEIERAQQAGKFTAEEYARALEAAGKARDDAQKADINRRLTDFFGEPSGPHHRERASDKTKAQNAADNYSGLSDPTQHLQGGQGVMAGIEDYLARVGTMADQVAAGIEDTLGAAVSGITDGIMGWVDGTKTFSQAISGIGQSVLRAMLQSLIQIGAQWVINKILVIAGIKTIDAVQDESRIANVAKTNAANLATMPGHLAGAAAAGISSFGLALIFGALAVALIASLAGGFAEGGYTAAGGRNDVAGVVHAGEWVAPGWMVNHPQFGGMIAGLESARNGGAGFGSIGGILTSPGFQPNNVGGGGTNVHVYIDREAWTRAMLENSGDHFREISAQSLRQNS